MEEAGSPGCRPGVSGEVLLLYVFLSIPPSLLLLRALAFSKEGVHHVLPRGLLYTAMECLTPELTFFLDSFRVGRLQAGLANRFHLKCQP